MVWKKEITRKGQKFLLTEAFRYNIWKYVIAHQFEYKLERNCKQRIIVKYKAKGCDFYIFVKGHLKVNGMIPKDFKGQHKHSTRDRC